MNYISKAFQIQYLSYYKLYIVSNHQEELLLVMDDTDSVQVILQYPSDAPTTEATKLLALPFREVVVVLPQQNVTFIPREVYQEGDRALYGEYLINRNNLEIQSVDLENARVIALFQYDGVLWKRWNTLYPEAQFVPAFVSLFNQIGIETAESKGKLLIHMNAHQTHFLFVQDGHFKFYNVFHADTWEDIAYYTLKVIKGFDLTKIDKIVLSGISSGHEYTERLKTFAEQVSVWEHGIDGSEVEFDGVSNLNLVFNYHPCAS